MPTYEYKCAACGHKFERFQSITAAPVRKCPTCGKSKVRRLIGSGGGLIFKGSGFYITDYRDGSGPKKDSEKSKEPEKAAATSSDGKTTESKPAETAAAAAKPAETSGKKSKKQETKS